MTIGTLTSLGVARNLRAPNKSDSGEALDEDETKTEKASLPQILVKQVPTGLVAAYTALTATIVQLIDEPTSAVPQPDLLLSFRWAAFVILVIFSMGLTFASYRAKVGPGARWPIAEVLGVSIAAAVWGLLIPESPMLAMNPGDRGVALIAVIGFVGIGLNLLTAQRLLTKAPAKASKVAPATETTKPEDSQGV